MKGRRKDDQPMSRVLLRDRLYGRAFYLPELRSETKTAFFYGPKKGGEGWKRQSGDAAKPAISGWCQSQLLNIPSSPNARNAGPRLFSKLSTIKKQKTWHFPKKIMHKL
jgi:hypothetical protein